MQFLSSTSGELTVALLPGREVGPGVLELKSGELTDTVPLQLLPEVRGLTVAGSGLVGVGASPDAYGAITARGRIDSRTSLTLGAMTWSGFGSFTSQSLRQLQIRGAGISGPYELGADVQPGTEQLRIETRALDNPERIVATQAVTRFVDYQIDYERGVVLFKQAIPATDARGNPLFIVATFEALSGGAQKLVAGGRATLDVRQPAPGP